MDEAVTKLLSLRWFLGGLGVIFFITIMALFTLPFVDHHLISHWIGSQIYLWLQVIGGIIGFVLGGFVALRGDSGKKRGILLAVVSIGATLAAIPPIIVYQFSTPKAEISFFAVFVCIALGLAMCVLAALMPIDFRRQRLAFS